MRDIMDPGYLTDQVTECACYHAESAISWCRFMLDMLRKYPNADHSNCLSYIASETQVFSNWLIKAEKYSFTNA